jgi:hypothetical protein
MYVPHRVVVNGYAVYRFIRIPSSNDVDVRMGCLEVNSRLNNPISPPFSAWRKSRTKILFIPLTLFEGATEWTSLVVAQVSAYSPP